MRTHVIALVVAASLLVPISFTAESHNVVPADDIMEQITVSMMTGYIQTLQDIGPRVTGTQGTELAAQYISSEFQSYGLAVQEIGWEYQDYEDINVEATLPGVDPASNQIFIICAHYDTVPGSPGADDDGSGTAAVMAAAQVLSQYQFRHTIKFVTFSGEEEGLLGSHEYARVANETGENIKGVLNADMIGYTETAQGREMVTVQETTSSMWITNLSINITHDNPDLDLQIERASARPYSDHFSFIRYNFNASFFFEYEFNDYYHSPDDILEHMDMGYCTRVTRLMVGTLVSLAEQVTGDWTPPQLSLITPAPGNLYLNGLALMPLPFGATVVLGGLIITAEASDEVSGMDRIEFYIDGELKATDTQIPYEFVWDEPALFRHSLNVQAYDQAGNYASIERHVWTIIL
jgi:leucyl aminopeptidase